MLLWEVLAVVAGLEPKKVETRTVALHSRRLPFDTRCAALTKCGDRCKGKVLKESHWCLFHDPVIAEKRKRALASGAGRARNRLRRLPDGYLRKLSNRRAVGNAMDRLYREVRLGLVTPGMGEILFNILGRLMDSGLLEKAGTVVTGKAKADRLRPKLRELLTRAERTAWRKAVAETPESFLQFRDQKLKDLSKPEPKTAVKEHPAGKTAAMRALQAG